MSHYCRDVQLFHNKFGLEIPSDFTFLNRNVFDFRVKFFYEELTEYVDSCSANDLGTAVDSLIDLVYITCGTALFHGIGFDKFDEILDFDHKAAGLESPNLTPTGNPHFLTPADNSSFIANINSNIEMYIDASEVNNADIIKRALASIYLNCMFASTKMDLTNEQWDEMWADVQRANMSKERATSATQSKRSSTLDVFKPEGWIPPRTEELIASYLRINNGTIEA